MTHRPAKLWTLARENLALSFSYADIDRGWVMVMHDERRVYRAWCAETWTPILLTVGQARQALNEAAYTIAESRRERA